MAITNEIQCAYCSDAFESDEEMYLHKLNNHKEESQVSNRLREDEDGRRNNKRKNKTIY